jgi:hypothetical protein
MRAGQAPPLQRQTRRGGLKAEGETVWSFGDGFIELSDAKTEPRFLAPQNRPERKKRASLGMTGVGGALTSER